MVVKLVCSVYSKKNKYTTKTIFKVVGSSLPRELVIWRQQKEVRTTEMFQNFI